MKLIIIRFQEGSKYCLLYISKTTHRINGLGNSFRFVMESTVQDREALIPKNPNVSSQWIRERCINLLRKGYRRWN